MSDFLVEPPPANSSVKDWNAWIKAEERARIQQKRKATMECVHQDPDTYFAGQSLAFEGSEENDTLTLTVAVYNDYDQSFRKPRGSTKKRRPSGAARRKRRRMFKRI